MEVPPPEDAIAQGFEYQFFQNVGVLGLRTEKPGVEFFVVHRFHQ
jgi:hypothetical protein